MVQTEASSSVRVQTLAVAALLLLTTVLYLPVLQSGFCLMDDSLFVGDNPRVRAGLRLSTVTWALRTVDVEYWHPLTWLSHAADVQLFGLDPAGHHATSLVLHLIAVALVFFAVRALTGAGWRSLAVAALFALHPMNVESVAWIAERKNTLSAVFYAATLLAYAAYARRPGRLRYAGVTVLQLAGLASKPMLVTVPFVLLLLDFWPLDRWRPGVRLRLVLEKLPWLALSVAISLVTVRAQDAAGTLAPLEGHGLGPRTCFAVAGYGAYLSKLFWPSNLCIYFPPPTAPCQALPVWATALTLIVIVAVAGLRTRPFLGVGWAWFFGMLLPVCGMVRVGAQFIADRYVYHPMIGLAVAVVFGATERMPPRVARAGGVGLAIACALLAWRTHVEVGYWRSNETLFARAVAVAPPNCVAATELGVALRNRGDVAGAMLQWETVISQCPNSGGAHSHLGVTLASRGDLDRAMLHFARAAEISPELASDMGYNIGLALWQNGRRDEALAEFRRVLTMDPQHQPSLKMLRLAESAAP
jgi:protein O-mannosyl-transferase